MDSFKPKTGGPEAPIQEAIIKELRYRGWYVDPTHGNMFMSGWPDLFCCHINYGHRWIEVKDPARKGLIFTPAQMKKFPLMCAHGAGVWVATTHVDVEKLITQQAANWHMYLLDVRGVR